MNMIQYNSQIPKIIDFINKRRFEVELFSNSLPSEILGRIFYYDNIIKINAPTAKLAILTLAHEAGHLVSYNRLYLKKNLSYPCRDKREFFAYQYGWYVIKTLDLPISKEEWKEFHV